MAHKEIYAMHEVVQAIEQEIVMAEDHLDCALKMAHRPELAMMYLKSAEMKCSAAEDFLKHKHAHMAQVKATGKDQTCPVHKSLCDMWQAKHPELHEDLDEMKFKIQQYKGRATVGSPMGNPVRY